MPAAVSGDDGMGAFEQGLLVDFRGQAALCIEAGADTLSLRFEQDGGGGLYAEILGELANFHDDGGIASPAPCHTLTARR